MGSSTTPGKAGKAGKVFLGVGASTCSVRGGVDESDELEPESLPREEKVSDTGEESVVVD